MANEATIIELLGQPKGEPIRYACADAVGIERGTLLAFDNTKARTISGSNIRTLDAQAASNIMAFAGIAAEEKVANDGATSIGVWTKGVFDLLTGQAVAPGQLVSISGANKVRRNADIVAADLSGGAIVGIALESGSAGDTIAIKLGGGY